MQLIVVVRAKYAKCAALTGLNSVASLYEMLEYSTSNQHDMDMNLDIRKGDKALF